MLLEALNIGPVYRLSSLLTDLQERYSTDMPESMFCKTNIIANDTIAQGNRNPTAPVLKFHNDALYIRILEQVFRELLDDKRSKQMGKIYCPVQTMTGPESQLFGNRSSAKSTPIEFVGTDAGPRDKFHGRCRPFRLCYIRPDCTTANAVRQTHSPRTICSRTPLKRPEASLQVIIGFDHMN